VKQEFKIYIKLWNAGALEDKYYKALKSLIEAKNRSRIQLESTKKILDTVSNMKDQFTEPTRLHSQEEKVLGSHKREKEEVEEMDEEDRARYQKKLKKKEEKSYAKSRESDLEDLVPKKTGNDAMREKRKEKASYTKKEDDTFGDEINDRDMFNGGDDFQRRVSREKEKRDKIEQKKKDQYEQKLSQYKASEEKKIEQLKGLLTTKGNFTSGGKETFGY